MATRPILSIDPTGKNACARWKWLAKLSFLLISPPHISPYRHVAGPDPHPSCEISDVDAAGKAAGRRLEVGHPARPLMPFGRKVKSMTHVDSLQDSPNFDVAMTRQSRRRGLAWPSEAVSDVLQPIPEEIEPVITEEQWASTDIPRKLDLEGGLAFLNRLLTWYLINRGEQIKAPILPSTTRKTLQRKATQIRDWADTLDSLNSVAALLEARAQIFAGDPVAKKKSARAQIACVKARLSKVAADLERAANQLPREVRRATQQSEVLHHAIYILHVLLRRATGEGLSRKGLDRVGKSNGKSPSADLRREFAVWLFRKADPKLPERTILTAAEKAIEEYMQADRMADEVHETIASVWNG